MVPSVHELGGPPVGVAYVSWSAVQRAEGALHDGEEEEEGVCGHVARSMAPLLHERNAPRCL